MKGKAKKMEERCDDISNLLNTKVNQDEIVITREEYNDLKNRERN